MLPQLQNLWKRRSGWGVGFLSGQQKQFGVINSISPFRESATWFSQNNLWGIKNVLCKNWLKASIRQPLTTKVCIQWFTWTLWMKYSVFFSKENLRGVLTAGQEWCHSHSSHKGRSAGHTPHHGAWAACAGSPPEHSLLVQALWVTALTKKTLIWGSQQLLG